MHKATVSYMHSKSNNFYCWERYKQVQCTCAEIFSYIWIPKQISTWQVFHEEINFVQHSFVKCSSHISASHFPKQLFNPCLPFLLNAMRTCLIREYQVHHIFFQLISFHLIKILSSFWFFVWRESSWMFPFCVWHSDGIWCSVWADVIVHAFLWCFADVDRSC